jgi:hypothetical protein
MLTKRLREDPAQPWFEMRSLFTSSVGSTIGAVALGEYYSDDANCDVGLAATAEADASRSRSWSK